MFLFDTPSHYKSFPQFMKILIARPLGPLQLAPCFPCPHFCTPPAYFMSITENVLSHKTSHTGIYNARFQFSSEPRYMSQLLLVGEFTHCVKPWLGEKTMSGWVRWSQYARNVGPTKCGRIMNVGIHHRPYWLCAPVIVVWQYLDNHGFRPVP